MFGKRITRYCPNCKEDRKVDVSVGYFLECKHYYTNCICPTCKADLSIEDRKILNEVKKAGKEIGVAMY